MNDHLDAEQPAARPRLTTILPVAIITLGFLVWAGLFISHWSFIALDGQRYFNLADDALISMRYAWNLAHGQGLVWNPGERVEGYTNLLMTLWMALVQAILQDKRLSVLTIQLSGVLILLANAWVITRITTLVWPDHQNPAYARLRPLAFFAALAYFYLDFWALVGMETGLVALLNSLGILFALLAVRSHRWKYLAATGVALGLSYVARPDSLIVAVLVMAYVAYRWLSQRRDRPTVLSLLGMAGVYAVLPFAQEIFRLAYYGQLVPNTYTLKVTGVPLMIRLEDGIHFITPFLISLIVLAVMVVIALALDFSLEKLLPVLILAAMTAYEITVGGDPWIEWRIMSPGMPLVLAFFCFEVWDLSARAVGWAANRSQRAPVDSAKSGSLIAVSLLAGLVALAAFVEINFDARQFIVLRKRPIEIGYGHNGVDVAIILRGLLSPQASIGVVRAGVVPYYTDLYAIDYLGKSDAYIAQLPPDISGAVADPGMHTKPGHNKYDLNYSLVSKMPAYTEVLTWGHDDVRPWAALHYASVTIQDQPLWLSMNSKDVHWDTIFGALASPGEPGPARLVVVDSQRIDQHKLLGMLLPGYFPGATIIGVLPTGIPVPAGTFPPAETALFAHDPALAAHIAGANRLLYVDGANSALPKPIDQMMGPGAYLIKDRSIPVLHVSDYRQRPDLSQVKARFGDAITLQGFDLSDFVIATCGKIDIATWWQIEQPVDFNYSLFIGLRKDGQVIAQKDGPPANSLMLQWKTGATYRDVSPLDVPCGAQPGDYQVILAIYNYETLKQLPVAPGPDTLFQIGTITIQ